RDLKPGNIIVDADGEPHITDFGLARRLGTDSSLTLTGCPIGTPAYMSPEQARGEKTVTTAADIWSLGVILYELLAARPPFQAENVPALLRKIVEDEPAPLHPAKSAGRFPLPRAVDPAQGSRPQSDTTAATPASRALVDPDLATICLRCLEKEPARRYASAAELAEDLDRWRRNEPILARRATSWERA
ncbi:MAG: serine/threonine protein kinase, partial [Planctomycetaceae bacterium]|nr:serine/threonine protein kinase [Planctomycetaceae bacterium]